MVSSPLYYPEALLVANAPLDWLQIDHTPVYSVSHKTFCLRALGIPIEDNEARQFYKPTKEVLQRLSDGSGIAVDVLEQMTFECIWDRLMDEMSQQLETPEGQATLKAMGW
ncbi:MAG: hypothetical protein P1U32_03075 [Legionellaceae bacterium]|nr:hypothetical protein [Legionellaceae bacterium]